MHDEFCEVFFDNVRVPAENLVGEVNKGWSMAKALLGFERLFLGSPRLAAYALARFQDLGHHRDIASDPVYRADLARLSARMESHKALFAAFLRKLEGGQPVGPEISLLKISVTELFREITEQMLIYAGPEAGHTEPLSEDGVLNPSGLFLQARPSTIYGGSSEIQRNIIAKAVLGLPG
jgi:alkylation response protein AidB-like acyl-CoA dehydrogenase